MRLASAILWSAGGLTSFETGVPSTTALPLIYDPGDVGTSATRRLPAQLHDDGSRGIAYDSLDRPPGRCVAVCRARDIGVPVTSVGTIERERHRSSSWLPSP